MKPFLFSRGCKNYARFFVPTFHRALFGGRQYLVFALGAGQDYEIRLKASIIEGRLWNYLNKGQRMDIDWDKIKKYEIDLGRGVFKADGPEDHSAMMDAIKFLQPSISAFQAPVRSALIPIPATPDKTPETSLLLTELLAKFYLLKQVKPATVKDYDLTIGEFVKFYKSKCHVAGVVTVDITRYREFLGEKGNSPRTIDKKVGALKSIFNFGIEQGYYQGKNPAMIKNLLTKKQKEAGGFLIFEKDEIKQIFTSEYFKQQRQEDPDYYWACLLILLTGARHEEVCLLSRGQVKVSENGNNYIQIRDSKTSAGIREVPFPAELMEMGFAGFIADKKTYFRIFRYKAGNALGKKFARNISDIEKINRGKLVLHSLRKFLNDFMMKNKILLEARCQFMGHEVENVNVGVYTDKFNIDEMHEMTKEVMKKVMLLAGIILPA